MSDRHWLSTTKTLTINPYGEPLHRIGAWSFPTPPIGAFSTVPRPAPRKLYQPAGVRIGLGMLLALKRASLSSSPVALSDYQGNQQLLMNLAKLAFGQDHKRPSSNVCRVSKRVLGTE